MEHLLRAIEYAHKQCGDTKGDRRKWLKSSGIPPSYDREEYLVDVQVLEGSPPRAILVTTPEWTKIIFWDGWAKGEKTFRRKP